MASNISHLSEIRDLSSALNLCSDLCTNYERYQKANQFNSKVTAVIEALKHVAEMHDNPLQKTFAVLRLSLISLSLLSHSTRRVDALQHLAKRIDELRNQTQMQENQEPMQQMRNQEPMQQKLSRDAACSPFSSPVQQHHLRSTSQSNLSKQDNPFQFTTPRPYTEPIAYTGQSHLPFDAVVLMHTASYLQFIHYVSQNPNSNQRKEQINTILTCLKKVALATSSEIKALSSQQHPREYQQNITMEERSDNDETRRTHQVAMSMPFSDSRRGI